MPRGGGSMLADISADPYESSGRVRRSLFSSSSTAQSSLRRTRRAWWAFRRSPPCAPRGRWAHGDIRPVRSTTDAEALPRPAQPVYYGWAIVFAAAAAMVGTLPGRTQGLGLITEPLLRDLQLTRVAYAQINLAATLIGALFCFGIGTLLDRAGSRVVLTALALVLGMTVLGMSAAQGIVALAILITLTRGLGQSALSIVSLSMVGK